MSDDKRQKRNAYMREWKRQNKEKVNSLARTYRKRPVRRKHERERLTAYRKANPEATAVLGKRATLKALADVVAAYGGKCSCCGETEHMFLTIDHIFNDGGAERAKHQESRKGTLSGVHLYRRLRKLGFPKDRYRLLCFNCNCGRYRNGGDCPHSSTRE